jgi:hypothetical protein
MHLTIGTMTRAAGSAANIVCDIGKVHLDNITDSATLLDRRDTGPGATDVQVKPTQAAADQSHMVDTNYPAPAAFSRGANQQEDHMTRSGSYHHNGITT